MARIGRGTLPPLASALASASDDGREIRAGLPKRYSTPRSAEEGQIGLGDAVGAH